MRYPRRGKDDRVGGSGRWYRFHREVLIRGVGRHSRRNRVLVSGAKRSPERGREILGTERSKRDRENRVRILGTKLLPERTGVVLSAVHFSKKDGRNRGVRKARVQKALPRQLAPTSFFDYRTASFTHEPSMPPCPCSAAGKVFIFAPKVIMMVVEDAIATSCEWVS